MKKLIVVTLLALILTGCNSQPDTIATSASSDASSTASTPQADSSTGAPSAEEPPKISTAAHETNVDISESADGVIEIKEKMFVAQTNEIYLNCQDYLGKTFSYEGLFLTSDYDDRTYYYVARYGPGCCGYDATAGFEVVWDGEFPELEDWVHAVGILEMYEEDGAEYLQLRLNSLEVLDKRGTETVTQ